MKLNYYIEFSEIIEDVQDIEPDELNNIQEDIENELRKYLKYSGVQLVDDAIKLEFDLEE